MKKLYVVFAIGVVIDSVVAPAMVVLPWLPYFSLIVLPALALFAPKRPRLIVFSIAALIVWLTSALNAGIVVFSFALFLLFERLLIIRFFRHNAWQTILASAGGVLVLGLSLSLLSLFLTPQTALSSTVFFTRIIITTLFSMPVIYLTQKISLTYVV